MYKSILKHNTISLAHTRATKVLMMNSKGGVGKSTLVVGTISRLLEKGHKVFLIDFDKQKSSHDWALDIMPGFVGAYNPSYYSLSELAVKIRIPKDIDFVIVDSPSNFTQIDMVKYAHFMDGIIVPMAPSPIDLHASLPLIKALIESKVLRKKNTSLSFIINRCHTNDERLNKVIHLLNHFRNYPTLGKISESSCYQDSFHNRQLVEAPFDTDTWERVENWLKSLNAMAHHR